MIWQVLTVEWQDIAKTKEDGTRKKKKFYAYSLKLEKNYNNDKTVF